MKASSTETMISRFHRMLRATIQMRFVQNIAVFQVGTLFTLALGFVTSVMYPRLIGLEAFGLYAVILAFVGLGSMCMSYGQETSTTTFLAEAQGRKDKQAMKNVLRYYVQMTILSTCVGVAFYLSAPALANALQGDVLIGKLGRLIIVNSMLQPPTFLLFLALQLEHRIGTIVFLESASDVLQITLSILLLLNGWGVEGILIGTLAISLISAPIFIVLFERSAKRQGLPSLLTILPEIGSFRGTTGYALQGLWIALDRHVSRNAYPNLFIVILDRIAPREIVGLFKLGLKLAQLPAELVNSGISRMSSVSIPKIATQDRKALKKSCIRLISITLAIMTGAVLGAVIFIPLLVPIVYGSEFTGVIPIFLAILPFNFFSAMNIASVPLARVYRKVWAMTLVNLTGIGIGISLFFLVFQYIFPLGIAMGISILYYHSHSLLLYAILYYDIHRKNPIR